MRGLPLPATAGPARVAAGTRSQVLDALCIFAGIALILVVCVVLSRGRILWEDEVLGWTLLRDPSWRHMLQEWSGGADNGGVLFYLTGRVWLQVFGPSALAFRMYSATGFAAAFAVLWMTLRRYYSRQTLALAIGAVWFLGPQVVAHICEGRFYGLFLFAAMLTLFVTLRLAGDLTQANVPVMWLVLTFLAHATLVTSHLLGLVYSIFLLAALMVCDAMRQHLGRPMRWRVYLSVVPAWLLLAAEQTAIASAMDNGRPHFWATRPGLHQLFGAYHTFDANVNRALLAIALVLAIVWWRHRSRLNALVRESLRSRIELYIVVLALALVPLAFFVESWIGTPIFVNRYLLPVTVVPIIFAAEAMRLIGSTIDTANWQSYWRSLRFSTAERSTSAVFFAFLLVWIFTRLPRSIPQRQDYTQALAAALPSGSVVVLPDGLAYTEVIARQYDSPVHFHYLLDWQRSIAPAAPKADVSQFHLLSGWKHAGYFAGSVEDQASFIQQHPAFFVVETRFDEEDPDPSATGTLLASLARTPGEVVRSYPSILLPGVEDRVWLVCRGACPVAM